MENLKLQITAIPDGLRIGFGDLTGTIRNDEGAEVGSVMACLGGGFQVKIGGKAYFVSSIEIWNAFADALGLHDQKFKID